MRKVLDALYQGSGVLAGVFLVLIGVVVLLQVGANVVDLYFRYVTGAARGLLVPSYTDFTGFFLAASSFLALAYTLRSGGHIRVAMLLHKAPPRARRGLEIWCSASGLFFSCYATWFAGILVLESYEFGDMSIGMVPVPMWIPQLAMLFGLLVLSIALLDQLVVVLRGGIPPYLEEEEAAAKRALARRRDALDESVNQI